MGILDIFSKYSKGEIKIMGAVEDLKATLEEVKTNNQEVLGKVNAVLSRLDELQQGATPAQIAELQALANEVKSGVQGTEDQLDAAPLPGSDE